ncbi:MAG: hypothetical protein E7298_14300 [Lachnospiraceae bacterium]|nr:hypothetical protein [Lachnospiraceae bacterium]
MNEMVEQSRTFWLCKAKIQQLFKRIYTNDHSVKFTELDTILSVFEHDRNFLSKSIHTAVFTANMSAGKSTLVNALVGKKVNKSQSMACTAKLHYILNKPLEDGFSAEDDNVLNLDADYNTLMTDDVGNDSQSIIVSTYFRFLSGLNNPICFLDTPGVNSSLDHTHKAITDTEIGKNEFDVLVYVINADGGIATEDEDTYLTQLSETAGKANILFVVNKIDCFRADEDNIADSISKIADDVSRRGFVNPKIYPVSAYAGYLAKRMLFDNDLNEGEMDDYNLFRRNFMSEDYNLVGFYPKDAIDVCLRLIEREEDVRKKKAIQMLLNCGILPLEIILKNSIGGM